MELLAEIFIFVIGIIALAVAFMWFVSNGNHVMQDWLVMIVCVIIAVTCFWGASEINTICQEKYSTSETTASECNCCCNCNGGETK